MTRFSRSEGGGHPGPLCSQVICLGDQSWLYTYVLFTPLGSRAAVRTKAEITRQYYNTAWVPRIALQGPAPLSPQDPPVVALERFHH